MPLSDLVAAWAGLSLCLGYHATNRLGSSPGWSFAGAIMPLSDWVAALAGLSLCWGYHATIRLGSSLGWSESLLGLSCHYQTW